MSGSNYHIFTQMVLESKMKKLLFFILVFCSPLLLTGCGSKKVEIHEGDIVKIDDYEVKLTGVSRFEDVIYVTIFIYRPEDHPISFNPHKDFALLDKGKSLKLDTINSHEITAENYAVTGDVDDNWSLDYKFEDYPEDLIFQIKDKKFLRDTIYEYKVNDQELRY